MILVHVVAGKNLKNVVMEKVHPAILEIIKESKIGAYAVSLLCMLLGFYENEKSEKLLWDYYHYFKEHYNDETYSDGPLLGLLEIRERRKERSIDHRSN